MNRDIAIIGMAGRFPEAANIYEFYQNLRNGRDSVRPVDEKRIADTALPTDLEYQTLGYLDDIDKFDHKFFNISFVEAQNMDPQQRQALEVAYETFESAGYNIDHFYNSKTAVFVSGAEYQYQKLVDILEPTAFSGNTHYTTAGRISRSFHLRGAAAVTDTGCSSALVAVNMACNEIWLGNADYALAVGVRLIAFPALKKLYIDVGITSKDGKTKSFADDSFGSGSCETVGAVLLKPLDKAIEDKDVVYAVIKGAAMNQNGQHSGSLTATSSVAQAEAMKEAWQKSGIDPLSISYIEAHGSGTKLGDPIEISGIDTAFRAFTDKKKFVAVSCVKTNIGHTDTAAGIAGLLKASLSVHKKELFPSLHFDKPNPFIDFENSAVYINTLLKPWEIDPAIGIRRAGVNSFGFAGNNTHVILEEAKDNAAAVSADGRNFLFAVSSKTSEGLRANIKSLHNYLKENKTLRIQDIAYTLCKGRKHYERRVAFKAQGIDQLLTALEQRFDVSVKEPLEVKKLVFLFSPDTIINEDLLAVFREHEIFDACYRQCEQAAKERDSAAFKRFAFQYSFYNLLLSFGIKTENVLGIGAGEHVVAAVLTEMSLGDAIASALNREAQSFDGIEDKVYALVERETEAEKALFVEMGPEGLLSRTIRSLEWPNSEEYYDVISLNSELENPLIDTLQQLYLNNYQVNWSLISIHNDGRKIYLPTYQFEKTRCWLDPYKGKEAYAANHPAYYLATVVDPNITKSKVVPAANLPAQAIINQWDKDVVVNEDWTDTQKKIAKIWGQVLKLEKVGLDDDFFRMGGHSLYGVQVTNRIEKEFGVKLMFKDIMTFSTVRLVSHGVDNLVKQKGEIDSGFREIPTVEEAEHYSVSNSQRRLWVVNQLEGDNTAYNLPSVVRIEGKVDKNKFEKVFKTLIQRHEILRTSFPVINGEPVQKVHTGLDFHIEEIACTEQEIDANIKAFIRPFDLQKGPLLRVSLLKTGEEKSILLFDMHHIIADGTAVAAMIKEFFALFDHQPLPDLRIQYKDYAAWHKNYLESEEMKAQEAFWLAEFEDTIPVLNLPTDFVRPAVQSFEGAELQFELDKELSEKLRNLARDSGTTLYMLMLAAYNIILSKYSGDENIVVGSPVAGRSHADLENMLGVFINTLTYKNKVSTEHTFEDFLAEVRANCFKVYQHQDYPFETLVNKLNLQRDMSRNPIFDVLFLFQNQVLDQSNDIQGLTFGSYDFDRKTSQFDLTLEVKDMAGRLGMRIEYCSKLFKAETIRRFREHFMHLLNVIVEKPQVKIRDITISSAAEVAAISAFNKPVTPAVATTFVDAFEDSVALRAEQTALICGAESYSYATLNKKANAIAEHLRSNYGVKPGDVVAISGERSLSLVLGILGIIKSGAAYLPLDFASPDERNLSILKDSKAKGILCADAGYDTFTGFQLDYTKDFGELENLAAVNKADDLLYVIYTSGSTGLPKGVMVEHRNVFSFSQNLSETFGIASGDRVLASTSITFDISVLELLSTLLSGNTIVLLSQEEVSEPENWLQVIEKSKIDVLQATPSRIKMLFNASGKDALKRLKVLLTGGEALPDSVKDLLLELKDTQVYNVYGPTETTIWSSSWPIGQKQNLIGRPLLNEQLYILSPELQSQPIGIYGEICIGGAGVARGYLNNEALSSEKFIRLLDGERVYKTGDYGRWNAKGEIEFGGRKDNQVKIRGYRIELSEIENTLLKLKDVSDAAVLIHGEDDTKTIVAFVVGKAEAKELKTQLAVLLPEYMIPSQIIKLDTLQLSSSGKIDRKALKAFSIETLKPEYTAPQNETEELLAGLFKDVLNVERVSVTDNFFELGGHSLSASILGAKIAAETGQEIALRNIFKYSTVRSLAEYIRSGSSLATKAIPPAEPKDYYPLSFSQKQLYVLQQFESAETIYNLPGALEVKGPLNIEKLRWAFNTIVSRHESLRTSFEMVAGEPMQKVQKQLTLDIPLTDLSAKSEVEINEYVNSLVQPFNLSIAPLFKISLIKIAENTHIIFYDMNHLVSDGSSVSVLVNEFIKLYKGEELNAVQLQFKDYSEWHNAYLKGTEVQKQKQFWTDYLSGAAHLELPADYKRSNQRNYTGERLAFKEPDLVNKIKTLSRRSGATPFMIVSAAYQVLLSKYSGVEDVVIGTPVAGRPSAALQDTMGMFVNTLALRNRVSADKLFSEFLEELKYNTLAAFENQEYPFEKVVEDLGLKSGNRNPLFDTVLVYQNMAFTSETISDLQFLAYPLNSTTAKFELTWELIEAENDLLLNLEFNSSLYKRATVEGMLRGLIAIITTVVENIDVKLGDIEVLNAPLTVESGNIQEFDFEF